MNRAWPALFLAPMAALTSIAFGLAVVGPACERGQAWLVHAVILICLAVAAGSSVPAWRALRRQRAQFMLLIAIWNGAFFSAVIIAQWIAQLFISPCMF